MTRKDNNRPELMRNTRVGDNYGLHWAKVCADATGPLYSLFRNAQA